MAPLELGLGLGLGLGLKSYPLIKGGGIVTSTILSDSRVMRDNTRMTDNG